MNAIERARHTVRELRELGFAGAVFRTRYELGLRARGALASLVPPGAPRSPRYRDRPSIDRWESPFADPRAVADAVRDRIPRASIDRLLGIARAATEGRIFAFGRQFVDYGEPIDWFRNPLVGTRFTPELPWAVAMREIARAGEIKLAWEIARFPHAYHLARAAAFAPETAPEFGAALAEQINAFVRTNRRVRGIHWSSGQEIALRVVTWSFALTAFRRLGVPMDAIDPELFDHIHAGLDHIDAEIDYARRAIYNNHILSESLALAVAPTVVSTDAAERYSQLGRAELRRQLDLQFKPDGAYLANSHNYHRFAVQTLFFAIRYGLDADGAFSRAVERSLDFLYAQQNPVDGRLPNYGANDGSMPAVLATSDFSDFRPLLQTASVLARGERLYDAGPWDEEVAWWCGPSALDLPLRRREQRSRSFPASGYHVARASDASTFATMRCGDVVDRFSQIDMLHVDVWYRGHDIAIDGGSYLYNGPHEWHDHFVRTETHNTIAVDDADQMLHWRRFKSLYWTRAKLLQFSEHDDHVAVAGEHFGYERLADPVRHRRSLLLTRDGVVIVLDRVAGAVDHSARLHWLLADRPYEQRGNTLSMDTPAGRYCMAIHDGEGAPLSIEVVRGREEPPRGWASRYFAEKLPTPSVSCTRTGDVVTFLTIFAPGDAVLEHRNDAFAVHGFRFAARDGGLEAIR